MNCSECEKLFDAYLDGHLRGSLRLEFDAHRLRCTHCQQTLAMLETIGNVLASDVQTPELSDDFTDRVVESLERPVPAKWSRPRLRLAVVAGAVLQAAAILMFALLWRSPAAPRGAEPEAPLMNGGVTLATGMDDADPERLRGLIFERAEDYAWEWHRAGIELTSNFVDMLRYGEVLVPDDVIRESEKIAGANPLLGIMESLVPAEEDEPEAVLPAADEIHSI